jgi:hypothetical protein
MYREGIFSYNNLLEKLKTGTLVTYTIILGILRWKSTMNEIKRRSLRYLSYDEKSLIRFLHLFLVLNNRYFFIFFPLNHPEFWYTIL